MIDNLIAMDRANPVKIAVIGDGMDDVYVHGHLEIGQEDCPKFMEVNRITVPGGALNAFRQLWHWNRTQPIFDCNVKKDIHVQRTLLFSNVDNIAEKIRFLINGKTIFRHDFEPSRRDNRKSEKEIFQELAQWNPAGILLSDYDKGFLTPEFIRQIVDYANERSIPVVADAKREPEIYGKCIIKGNIDHNRKFFGKPSLAIAQVMTRSDKPPVCGLDPNPHVCRTLPAVQCVNHIGAGDCFAAHLTLALAHGLSLEDAAEIAHSAGRVYVQHPHNRPPWPHEIRKDIQPINGKIIDQETLPSLRKSIEGKIVFTNGCFRLPHAGHSWLMEWAKQQGNTLIVGVNDDASVQRIKGNCYCLPLSERMTMLAAMHAVDWVVPFSADDPCEIIAQLSPDVIVKGSEYQGTHIPGSESVKDVRFAPAGPFPERRATTLVSDTRKFAHVKK